MKGVARTVPPRTHGDFEVLLGRWPAVGVVLQLVSMLERVARRGRPMCSTVHVVVVVVVV